MNSVHISNGEGQSKIYDEDQARALWLEGHFGDQALFWREGMANWQPLAVLFPPNAVYQPTPAYLRPDVASSVSSLENFTPRPRFQFTKDPTSLTKLLKVLLWIELGIFVLSALADMAQMSLVSQGSYSQEQADANDFRQGIIGMAVLVSFFATGIPFLMWIHRANVNCRGFGARNMVFTPGWSVGWYFIPFMNLVRPFQAMKEIWKVSSDPLRWEHQSGSGILGLWWALWISSSIMGNITFRTSMAVNDIASLETATVASLISGAVDIVLTLVAMRLISQIYQKQKSLTEME